jgi:hypothetical protein
VISVFMRRLYAKPGIECVPFVIMPKRFEPWLLKTPETVL